MLHIKTIAYNRKMVVTVDKWSQLIYKEMQKVLIGFSEQKTQKN